MAEVEGYDLEGFGGRVRSRRKELGLTQADLALRAKVDETAVRRWEDGVLPRDASTFARIAVALDTSVGWLLGETPDTALRDGILRTLHGIRRIVDGMLEDLVVDRVKVYEQIDTVIRGRSPDHAASTGLPVETVPPETAVPTTTRKRKKTAQG